MLLPSASGQETPERPPYAVWGLMLALSIVTAGALFSRNPQAVLTSLGVVPARFNPLSLLTYPFAHAGVAHLVLNLSYLWVFGGGVEAGVGWRRFLALFFGGGAFGGILQWLVTGAFLPPEAARTPILGASAGCSALVGLYAWRYYRSRITFVGLPYRPHVVAVVALFLCYEIGAGLWNLATGDLGDGVAHWAHIGGFVFGLTCARLMRLSEAGRHAYLHADAARSLEGNDPGEALRRCEALLVRDPEDADARRQAARCWLLLGDREQAAIHYSEAISTRLRQNRRGEAAQLYAEMRAEIAREPASDFSSATSSFSTFPAKQTFALASALEEGEEFGLAAETYRQVTVRSADAPEAETALLKVAGLYVHRLNRREEARVLLKLFFDRYPHSSYRSLAEQLRRATE